MTEPGVRREIIHVVCRGTSGHPHPIRELPDKFFRDVAGPDYSGEWTFTGTWSNVKHDLAVALTGPDGATPIDEAQGWVEYGDVVRYREELRCDWVDAQSNKKCAASCRIAEENVEAVVLPTVRSGVQISDGEWMVSLDVLNQRLNNLGSRRV
ncbi:MAG: hypothetical protein ACR2P2_10865 [Nakamurella sp.]